jgi:CMP-N-acetylneuraminic acid synthetase
MVKVSVILTNHNYGKYLRESITSVLAQTFKDFELIIIDDGSRDNSHHILNDFQGKKNVIILKNKQTQGIAASSNRAICNANGKYIIRLDADDYFDENALLVFTHFLDSNPDVAVVYPDYFKVRDNREIMQYVKIPKIGEEIKLLDIAANGAGAMFRKSAFDKIGGYDSNIRYQDHYDFWIKMITTFKVANINLPLFYYRQHGSSTSSYLNLKEKLQARRYIKEKFVNKNMSDKKLKTVGIIPAREKFDVVDLLPLEQFAGKPLLAYSVEEAMKAKWLNNVIVCTESSQIAGIAEDLGAEVMIRPRSMADTSIPLIDTVNFVISSLEKKNDHFDAVALLPVNCPFRTSSNIDEAVNTLLIYDAESVISVFENLNTLYQHGKHGLEAVAEGGFLKRDRDILYEENEAISLSKTEFIKNGKFFGQRLSHVLMTPEESLRIKDKFSYWIAKQMLEQPNEFF